MHVRGANGDAHRCGTDVARDWDFVTDRVLSARNDGADLRN